MNNLIQCLTYFFERQKWDKGGFTHVRIIIQIQNFRYICIIESLLGQFFYFTFGSNQNYPQKVHFNKSYSKIFAHFGSDKSFLITFLPRVGSKFEIL